MKRLLIVDDEEKIRLIIRKYGEFEGYEIEEAENGMQAIEICREKDFDLILLVNNPKNISCLDGIQYSCYLYKYLDCEAKNP